MTERHLAALARTSHAGLVLTRLRASRVFFGHQQRLQLVVAVLLDLRAVLRQADLLAPAYRASSPS